MAEPIPSGQRIIDYDRYVLRHPWPPDCHVQGSGHGLVFVRRSTKESYTTAFVEAFPRNPKTFIRGEGESMADAEDAAWATYQRILACPGLNGHEFDATGTQRRVGSRRAGHTR